MGQIDGFMKFDREMPKSRDLKERLKDNNEVYTPLDKEKVKQQASRCMDCGVPFCHHGCPLGNNIPDYKDPYKHKQLSRIYRKNLSCAMRSKLCA